MFDIIALLVSRGNIKILTPCIVIILLITACLLFYSLVTVTSFLFVRIKVHGKERGGGEGEEGRTTEKVNPFFFSFLFHTKRYRKMSRLKERTALTTATLQRNLAIKECARGRVHTRN